VTVFLTLNPTSAAVLGVLFLGETIGLSLVVGVVLVALGIWLGYRQTDPSEDRSRNQPG